MQADFARVTFDALKHYSRVLSQQGRVHLEADENEQVAILLHLLRTGMRDLVGPFAGPRADCGFAVYTPSSVKGLGGEEKERVKAAFDERERDLVIGPGRYYVDGILCENDRYELFSAQPDLSGLALPDKDGPALVYLDVFERAISALQDDAMREVALDGLDTSARAKVAWVVRIAPLSKAPSDGGMTSMKPSWQDLIDGLQPPTRVHLRAQAGTRDEEDDAQPCITSPHARYRGHENQLYRVELHTPDPKSGRPRFKVSRDNGTAVFPVERRHGSAVFVQHLGRDARSGLQNNQWVEMLDDAVLDTPQPLYQVADVDIGTRKVTLRKADGSPADLDETLKAHTFLRRWDQEAPTRPRPGFELREGAVLIPNEKDWIPLEDGIRIQFQAVGVGPPVYRPGDYWLIPARVVTGDIEWPQDEGGPRAVAPHGVTHHYAPLAALKATKLEVDVDCRPKFEGLPTSF